MPENSTPNLDITAALNATTLPVAPGSPSSYGSDDVSFYSYWESDLGAIPTSAAEVPAFAANMAPALVEGATYLMTHCPDVCSFVDSRAFIVDRSFFDWLIQMEFLVGYAEIEGLVTSYNRFLDDSKEFYERGDARRTTNLGGRREVIRMRPEHDRVARLAEELHPMAGGDQPTRWAWGAEMRRTVRQLDLDGYPFQAPRYKPHHLEGKFAIHVPLPSWDSSVRTAEEMKDSARVRARLSYEARRLGKPEPVPIRWGPNAPLYEAMNARVNANFRAGAEARAA